MSSSAPQTSSPAPPSSPPSNFWGRFKERQKYKSSEKTAQLRRRKKVDEKRKFITYKVWLVFWGLIIIWGEGAIPVETVLNQRAS